MYHTLILWEQVKLNVKRSLVFLGFLRIYIAISDTLTRTHKCGDRAQTKWTSLFFCRLDLSWGVISKPTITIFHL